jgi:addiction module HigA family antidote
MSRYQPFVSLGPGDAIKEELEYHGWSPKKLVEILDISEQQVDELLNNNLPITVGLAGRLSAAFQQSPQFWLNLDARNERP